MFLKTDPETHNVSETLSVPIQKLKNVVTCAQGNACATPLLIYAFLSPEPVVSWSRGRETRGRLKIKPSGSEDENAHLW